MAASKHHCKNEEERIARRRAARQRYNDRNPEKVAKSRRAYYERNREEVLARSREQNARRRGERASKAQPLPMGMEFIEKRSIPEPNSGCWIWLGATDLLGYGRIARQTYGESLAHRYAAKSAGLEIEGLLACHRCDNPYCVNPDHIFIGTHADNTADMVAKGRARGRYSKTDIWMDSQ